MHPCKPVPKPARNHLGLSSRTPAQGCPIITRGAIPAVHAAGSFGAPVFTNVVFKVAASICLPISAPELWYGGRTVSAALSPKPGRLDSNGSTPSLSGPGQAGNRVAGFSSLLCGRNAYHDSGHADEFNSRSRAPIYADSAHTFRIPGFNEPLHRTRAPSKNSLDVSPRTRLLRTFRQMPVPSIWLLKTRHG